MTGARPYVAEPVGDSEPAVEAARAAAGALALPDPQPLRAGMNALFLSGETVLRVGRTTADPGLAIALARRLEQHGIPVPAPASDVVTVVGDLGVTAWRQIEASDRTIDWASVGAIVRRVHELAPSDLPAGYPMPSPTSFPWWDFETMLADVGGEIDPEALAGLRAAIGRHRDWGEMSSLVVCHGDVHPGNVLMTGAGPVLLDWDLMCIAAPGWDHAMLVTLEQRWGGQRGTYAAFAAGYGRSLADDRETIAFAELRNVAATLMRVRAGRTSAVARAEAQRRLQYWRGEPGAPMWTAQ